MQPDLLWQKRRSGEQNNWLTDSVRGNTKILSSNTTQIEGTVTDCVTSFNSNGFTLGSNDAFNGTGTTNVMWQWRGGGAAVTNTAGSTTSTISANASSGFSVVTYTGTGANATVGHGLGVAPKMIFFKRRNRAGDDWNSYNESVGNDKFIRLNSNAGPTTFNLWQNTSPTSSVFYLSGNDSINDSGGTFVAYAFEEVAGYSKISSYTGNGSADGPFVYTGFRPRYLMIKNTEGVRDWVVMDTARNPYNLTNLQLYPNLSSAEVTAGAAVADIVSNGFKLRGDGGATNVNGQNYIYMAFCESPFKFANAR
jgi:hypothetical protein